MIESLVKKNRSYRKFKQSHRIEDDLLKELIDLTRFTASSRNLQPLKYLYSNHDSKNEKIFETLKWAANLKNWSGPKQGERPSAYIIILNDTSISQEFKKNFGADVGVAAQTILLAAVQKGLGGCMLANINRKKLRSNLNISDQYQIELVLALGKPDEEIKIDELSEKGDIKYYRDEKDVHHVPKRSLKDIIVD